MESKSKMESKLLDLHSDKSCFMIFGSAVKKKAVHDELDANPIKLYDEPMKEKVKEKILFIVMEIVLQFMPQ